MYSPAIVALTLTLLKLVPTALTATGSPPDFITLIIPPSQVNVNETVSVGFFTSPPVISAFMMVVNISLIPPDNSTILKGNFDVTNGTCQTPIASSGEAPLLVTQTR